jgi:2-polyprenyl-3-methyl-5-hydroxy-6-metoxy-1,4-benzoquinol methylase
MPRFDSIEKYENVNPKIVELYAGEQVILDIGCGTGALGARIKEINPKALVHGVDASAEAGAVARTRLDRFVNLDLDRDALPDLGVRYGLIILGDLLEHLKRPDIFLAALPSLMDPGCFIILSVPNIANYSIRLKLLWGEFNYSETGILDRTHLRFFTYRTIVELLEQCGFRISEQRFISRFPDIFARFMFRLLAVQFILKLERK